MIIRNTDGGLEVIHRATHFTDDAYYMKYANTKGIMIESPNHGTAQMNKIVAEITSSTNTPQPRHPKPQYRPRTTSIEK